MLVRVRYTFVVALLCLLVLFGCKDKSVDSAGTPTPSADTVTEAKEYVGKVGDVAVPFTVTTFSGEPFSLVDARGNPVVINMWASWCGPCKYEAPELQRAYEAYKDSGVLFLGVALQDSVENSMDFIEHFGWSFPAGPDDTGDIMKAYRVMAIPMTFIVNANGVVSYIHIGAIDEETIARELDLLL